MVMSPSDALISVCQAQILLLSTSLEVSSAIVYLTETPGEIWSNGEMPGFYPVVVFPDPVKGEGLPRLHAMPNERPDSRPDAAFQETVSATDDRSLTPTHQVVLPLVQDEVVLGVLVAERDRAVTQTEQRQLDAIRQTLTAACVLDQRSQWLDTQQQQQRLLQRQQKDVMDNLLHQFRNPLTAMRTFGKLLLKRMVESDGNREVASSIVRESDRLQTLLIQFESAMDQMETEEFNDVQSLPASLATLPASTSLGREVSVVDLDLLLILRPALQSSIAVMEDRNQRLSWAFPPAELPTTVRGDSNALAEVFSNLLDNASKYTPAGGQIHVLVQVVEAIVQVQITDNGYGIPPKDLPRLFERHFRGVQAESTIPGTGLGLAIARDLVRQMGGDIEVFSPTCSGEPGTTVQVTLRRSPDCLED